jgi:pimeloyl-ACP methyl ester carboxylesterase
MTRNGKGVHRDGYVQLPSVRLHYIDYGGSGETIIALHGLIQNARAFDAIVPALVPRVRLIALDLRGRGGSGCGPFESYRWSYYLSDLCGFFREIRISRFALLGSSMGGTLAMLYAMAHPNQVTRLVMNDTSLNTNREGVVRASLRVADAPTEFADFDSAVDWFAGGGPGSHGWATRR